MAGSRICSCHQVCFFNIVLLLMVSFADSPKSGSIPVFSGDLSKEDYIVLRSNLEGVSTSFFIGPIPLFLKGTHAAMKELVSSAKLSARENVALINYDVSREFYNCFAFAFLLTRVRADLIQFKWKNISAKFPAEIPLPIEKDTIPVSPPTPQE